MAPNLSLSLSSSLSIPTMSLAPPPPFPSPWPVQRTSLSAIPQPRDIVAAALAGGVDAVSTNANSYDTDIANDIIWPVLAVLAGGAFGVVMYVFTYRMIFGRGAARALMLWKD
jgi:hypothetical protein